MTTARIELPAKLTWVFDGEARYRGAWGGRGSGKTRGFALMAAVRAHVAAAAGETGVILCAREFMNSLDDSSMAEVKAAILGTGWLAPHFDVGEKYIRTRCGRVRFVFSGLRENLDSLKSKARILLAWIDEAEPVSEAAWAKLIPTVREDGSEIWVTWNPESSKSATHLRFRVSPPDDARIVELNWRDNPWFPAVLEKERRSDKTARPETYGWIWEGEFNDSPRGAYFTRQISDMRAEGRLGKVAADPLLPRVAYWDIGGTGAKSDARSIWIAQRVGLQLRVLRYRETAGQPLAADLAWLRDNGLAGIECVLPHDGATNDRVYAVSYESALRDAGHSVRIVPNMGPGAAIIRVEALRRVFPQIWMDESCEPDGLAALAGYREKWDERRNIGLGPLHDWASHGADAGGLMAVDYEQRKPTAKRPAVQRSYAGWMG